jgi:hypothetical protein
MAIKESDIKRRENQTGHAVFSPSQLYRIMLCPGSAVEATKAPLQPSSPYAARGTLLHDITKDIINNGFKLDGVKSYAKLTEEEDQGQVMDCVEYAWGLIHSNKFDGGTMWVEESVSLGSWGLPEVWGTSDFGGWTKDFSDVYVVDWKFGSGVQVFAENNEQGMAYAAGAIGYPNQFQNVHIVVVQPPLNHFDEWIISGKDLAEWVFTTLGPALDLAREPNPRYNPGAKQCRFCPAGMTCRARYRKTLASAQEVFKVYSNLANVTPAELSEALVKLRDVKTYASQIEKFAELELSHGRPFPGWKLVSGRSLRKWEDEEVAEAWLTGNSDIPRSKLYKKTFLSPAQAEKLDRRLKKDDNFHSLIIKPAGKNQLVSEDDPRPAVEPEHDATTAFADVKD